MPRSQVTPESAVGDALADAHRREWAFVLAAAVRVTRDLDLAEECVQDAYARAVVAWSEQGVPTRTGAWLTTAARNRAFDLIRRESITRRTLPLLMVETVSSTQPDLDEDIFGDDRLRLIFTCCHPTLSPPARVALTLRLVCGVTTAEIARSFLVSESTMAARITRAKKKIAAAHIPYRIPAADELPARTDAVLDVIHQLFTTGHTAPTGAQLVRDDLTRRALDLARMLRVLLPDDREVIGLLALIVLSVARADERRGPDGSLRLLADQDRTRWDAGAIAEGTALVRASLRDGPARQVSAAGRDQCTARRSADLGSHRLAPDRGPLRPSPADLADARGRAQPGGRDPLRGRSGCRIGRPGRARR